MQICNEADIGDGRMITAAEAPGAFVSCQQVFDRATSCSEPVRKPLRRGRPKPGLPLKNKSRL